MAILNSDLENSPCRLLRDVVLDELLVAILDGTLKLGERGSVGELSKLLGVSRTPAREAIAQLHTYGLVEIEVNRYARAAMTSLTSKPRTSSPASRADGHQVFSRDDQRFLTASVGKSREQFADFEADDPKPQVLNDV